MTIENIKCFQYSHILQRSYLILRSQKPLLGQDLVEEVEAASPCLLLLRRHFLLLLQDGAARQAVQPGSKFWSCVATRQATDAGYGSLNHLCLWGLLRFQLHYFHSWAMNKFIMCIVPQSYLYETFCRPPAPGLGNCPPLLYCSSQLPTLPRSFSGGLPSDISEQTLIQVCSFVYTTHSAFCNLLAHLKKEHLLFFYVNLNRSSVFLSKLLSVF